MNVGVFARPHPHHVQWLGAFVEGLKKHGVDFFQEDVRSATPCDLAVFWSHRHHHLIQQQKNAGLNYLVLERGFIGDREQWTSTGFNGLCGRAQWVTKDDPARFNDNFGELLKPWKEGGEYILVIGQCPGDMALNGLNFEGWLGSLEADLEHFGLPVKFRPHPLAGNVKSPFDRVSPDRPLAEDLAGARFVVTYSSTAGVESVLSGVPTVTLDPGSMAFDVGGHDLKSEPPCPDRGDWASRLAWCQWRQEEFESGEVWEHLKGFVEC